MTGGCFGSAASRRRRPRSRLRPRGRLDTRGRRFWLGLRRGVPVPGRLCSRRGLRRLGRLGRLGRRGIGDGRDERRELGLRRREEREERREDEERDDRPRACPDERSRPQAAAPPGRDGLREDERRIRLDIAAGDRRVGQRVAGGATGLGRGGARSTVVETTTGSDAARTSRRGGWWRRGFAAEDRLAAAGESPVRARPRGETVGRIGELARARAARSGSTRTSSGVICSTTTMIDRVSAVLDVRPPCLEGG